MTQKGQNMRIKKKVAIIGHFGGEENYLDGQTVKTKILYRELLRYTDWNIQKVDTYYRGNAPLKLLGQLTWALLTTRDIIIITSQNGRRFFFPILFVASKCFGIRVYHDVIGARLAKFTEEFPVFKKYLNEFRVNWVETNSLKQEMERLGILNCELLPNFKRLAAISADDLPLNVMEPYKLCTFSRVMQEKGIEDAVQAVMAVNSYFGRSIYTLDIYGQIDPGQIEWFKELQTTFPNMIRYGGTVSFDKSVEVLKDYFALLFPTRFYTEGVPGTIIDAYAAGLPVIAAKWESFGDVIEDGITGIGYPFGDNNALISILTDAVTNPELLLDMKRNCLQKAKEYSPEEVIKIMVEKLKDKYCC